MALLKGPQESVLKIIHTYTFKQALTRIYKYIIFQVYIWKIYLNSREGYEEWLLNFQLKRDDHMFWNNRQETVLISQLLKLCI